MIAGLVVLGTVLASVTVARGRFLRQRADADRQLRAAEAADRLLAEWTAGGTSFDRVPRSGSGPVNGADGFRWRTTERRPADAAALNARVVRLEVWDREPTTSARRGPAASLDLLVHDRPPRPANAALPGEPKGAR